MAFPEEEGLAQLLHTRSRETAQRLAREIQPATGDPYQAAYDELNQLTEESFKSILESPIGGENQMRATAELARAATGARQAIDVVKEPVKAYGGRELVSVFEEQQTGDFSLTADQFGKRVRLAGILQQVAPDKFDELVAKRGQLNESDRALLDRAFDAEFGNFIEDQFAGTPSFRDASPDRFESPRQRQLWEEFWGKMPAPGKSAGQGEIQEAYLREVKGDEWVEAHLDPNVRLTRQMADARKFAAEKFGQGVKAWYLGMTTAMDFTGKGALLLPIEAIERTTGKEVPYASVSGLIENATGADRQQQAAFAGRLAEAVGNEVLRPELIYILATSAGLYASGVGAPVGAQVGGQTVRQVATRVIANAMIGGFSNSGLEWAHDDSQSIHSLADDFVIGAFAEATLPEVMVAFSVIRGGKYSRSAVSEALENMGAKTRNAARIDGDNIIVLDGPPRSATLADVGIRDLNPDATHLIADELDNAVSEAHVLAVDSHAQAGRLAQEAAELERKYATQGALRERIARARRGQAGPVEDAESLVTDNQLAMARERAARAAASARTTQKTLNSLLNAAEVRRVEQTIVASRAQQGLDVAGLLKPDASGIVTLNGTETFFRGVNLEYSTPDNLLATPRRDVYITPQESTAQQFAERNTLTGKRVERGKVLQVKVKKGLKLLDRNGSTHDNLMEKIVNDPAYQKLAPGEQQAWRNAYMEKAGFDGEIVYKQGQPIIRVFNKQNVNLANVIQNKLDETQRLAALIDNEVSEQNRVVTTLMSDIRDPLQSPYAIRRAMNYVAAAASGRLPGSMQIVADAAINLRRSLDELTNPVVEKLALRVEKMLGHEMKNLTYIGPAKHAKWVNLYKREIYLSRPDLFTGGSAELRATLHQVQDLGDAKVALLQQHGYKIDALEGYYFPQFWENDPKSVQSALRGKVSVAKDRTFGDVIEGLENGLKPRNMSVRDILVAHDKMLNQGFGDVTLRNTMVKRGLIKAEKPSIAAKTYTFDSPLFRGYVGDKSLVQSVDSYFGVPNSTMQNVRSFAERVKNTTFGLFDLGVFGIQGTSAIMKGGWFAAIGEMTDSMLLRSLPGASRYESDAETFWKVLYTRNGGVLGTVSSGYDFEAGTLVGALPINGLRSLDRKITEHYMDNLSRLQFDTMLTPVRVSIFKGQLFVQHLLGQDISNPKVIRAAAEAANRATLTSRGAQTSTRRGLESMLLTSAASLRAEGASIASLTRPLVDYVTTGKLNGPEAITAYATLAHLAAMFYGIQYAVNAALGQPQDTFNPFRKEDWHQFGYLRIGNKKVAMVKERSLIKAMELSFEGLQAHDPEYVAEVWSKVFIGKLSPVFSAAASTATGYGYDTDGFFQTGELDTKSKLLNFVPFPLAIERLYMDSSFRTDPPAMLAEFLGFNSFDLSVVDRRDEFVKQNNPYPTDDPRHADVQASGYAGLERAEAIEFKQQHPEFFKGKNNMNDADAAVFQRSEEIYTDLLNLEQEVRLDPAKRRDYGDTRRELMTELGKLFAGRKSKDVTLQDKARTIYYDTINSFREQETGGVFTGDNYGVAEEAARRMIEAEYGEAGIAALDRSLVVGSTPLETEYRTARRAIADSGYYDIADAVVNAKSGGVWSNYHDFRESLNELAKERGMLPEQLPSFRDMDALISDAKEKFRERNPNVDAQLVIWDGLTPRSPQAADVASKVLEREIALAKDVQNRLKKQEKTDLGVPDFEEIINRFR